jgi:hypothetical protein
MSKWSTRKPSKYCSVIPNVSVSLPLVILRTLDLGEEKGSECLLLGRAYPSRNEPSHFPQHGGATLFPTCMVRPFQGRDQTSSIDLGQSPLSSLDRDRSASNRPSVWQRAQ